MKPREDIDVGVRVASKKQTPFSVWYIDMVAIPERGSSASKKQTPFSVWYWSR